ncbi:short-chain dehydrogenase [Paramyrothecium foliicola]|nr:short-chain dehydrogenase [Paramyrothecium foliicola]
MQNDFAKRKVHSRVDKVTQQRLRRVEKTAAAVPRGIHVAAEVYSWNIFYEEYIVNSGIPSFKILPKFHLGSSLMCLEQALQAVTMASAARQLYQSGLMVRALSHYGKAIAALNSALSDPVMRADDSVLITIFLLSLYEDIVPGYIGTGFKDTIFRCHIHFSGTLFLLRWRAERALDTELDKSIFAFPRHICLMSMFVNFEPCDVKWFALEGFANPWKSDPLLEPVLRRAVNFKLEVLARTTSSPTELETLHLIEDGLAISEDLEAEAVRVKYSSKSELPSDQQPMAFNNMFEVSTKTTEDIARSLYRAVRYHIIEQIHGLLEFIDHDSNKINTYIATCSGLSDRCQILKAICTDVSSILSSEDQSSNENARPGMACRAFGVFWVMIVILFSTLAGEESRTWAQEHLRRIGDRTGFGMAISQAHFINMTPTYDRNTRASDLTRHYAPQITGKTILITGVTPGGLGASFVKEVAATEPAILILAGRSIPKFQAVIDELNASHPRIKVKPLTLNLLSFSDVRKAAETVMSWEDIPHIDVLVNNAGIMAVPYHKSEDGFESQFQTNHLSHFLFTNLIMAKVLASETPRIVIVSSGMHRIGNIRWSDINFNEGKHYQRWLAYGQSKTANALMGLALAEKLGSKGLLSFPICPGVSFTNLSAHAQEDFAAFTEDLTQMDNMYGNKWLSGMAELHVKDHDQGAATHVFAAFDTGINKHNGAFLSDCHIADPNKEEVYSWATSKIDAERLWKLSEELVEDGIGIALPVSHHVSPSATELIEASSIRPLFTPSSLLLFQTPQEQWLWNYFIKDSSCIFQCYDETLGAANHQDGVLSTLFPAMAAFDGTMNLPPRRLFIQAFADLTSATGVICFTADSLLPQLAAALLLYRVDRSSRGSLLLLARGISNCIRTIDATSTKDPRYLALMAFLKWTDIYAYSSLTSPGLVDEEVDDQQVFSPDPDGSADHLVVSPGFEDWVAHPIYAFSQRLIQPLLKICRLAHKRRSPCGVASITYENISAVEEELLKAHDNDLQAYRTGGHVVVKKFNTFNLGLFAIILPNVLAFAATGLVIGIAGDGLPVLIWSSLFVGTILSLLVVSFAEFGSAYPSIAGCQFIASRLGGPRYGRVCGYMTGGIHALASLMTPACLIASHAPFITTIAQIMHPNYESKKWQTFLLYQATNLIITITCLKSSRGLDKVATVGDSPTSLLLADLVPSADD